MTASLACGPFFWLCAVGAVPAGALVGAAAGATAGAVKDADKKPPDEELFKLEALLEQIASERTLHKEIRDAAAALVPPGRRAPGKQADALVEVQLGDVRFQQDARGRYYWMIRVNLAAQWNRQHGRLRGGEDRVAATSASHPLDYWIDQDGTVINQTIDDLVAQLATRVELVAF